MVNLGQLSDSELMSLRVELGREINKLGTRISKKRDLAGQIGRELASRSEECRKSGGVLISDHAIVRYLERHTDLDMTAIRAEIVAMAKAAKTIEGTDRVRNGSAVFAMNKGIIATIMSDAEDKLSTA